MRALCRRFAADESGFSAVLMGLGSTVLLGFAGLAVDVGYWQYNQRNMQGAADQAAFAAATASQNGATSAIATTTASSVAAAMGFTGGQNNATVTVNNPPASGSYSTNSNAWEIIISQSQPMWLANMIPGMTAPTASVRAVVAPTATTVPTCVFAAKSSGQDTFKVVGTATADLSTCDLIDNSSDSKAVEANGGGTIMAKDAYIVGDYNLTGGGSFTVSGTLKTSSSTVADPYASRTAPTVGSCGSSPTTPSGGGSGSAYTVPSSTTIYPGVYCGGLTIGSSSGAVTFSPGIYIIKGGNFTISGGGGTLSGGVCTGSGGYVNATGGVTIYLVPNGTTTGTISVNGCFSISAPTTGNTAGIALWADKTEKTGDVDAFNGGATLAVTGAIYTPVHEVTYVGNTTANTSCIQIVAYTIQISGGANIKHSCSGVGIEDASITVLKLVQ